MAELLEREKRSVFYGWPMVIFFAGMLVFAIHACTHMVAAGDTWVAMACGRHHANHGVGVVEPFSANSHAAGPTEESIKKWPGWAQGIAKHFDIETIRKWHPTGWVNQNWLTHSTFYRLAKTFGSDGEYNYNALVYWKFTIFIIEVFCIYFFARLLGVSVPGAATSAALAMFVGRTFFDVRPACYGHVLTAVFVLVIALAVYRNLRYIWLIVPLTVFWANVHGGYIYIFMMMVPFIGIHFLAGLDKKWTVVLYSMGSWLLFYIMYYRFITNRTYELLYEAGGHQYVSPNIFSEGVFRFLSLLIILGIVLLAWRNMKTAAVYVYSLLGSVVFVLVLLVKMSPVLPPNLTRDFAVKAQDFISNSQVSFFVCIVSLACLGVILTFRKQNLVQVKPRALVHAVLASFTAFFAMVLLNPYRLTNLTHTFEISLSEHAKSWRTVAEWHPAFEWENKVGDEIPFLIMFIIGWIALAVWFFVRFLRPRIEVKRRGQSLQFAEGAYAWPKIDVVMITIAAFSVYMAVTSRRFIPIAASVACPVIALFIEQAVCMFLAHLQYVKTKRLEVAAVSEFWRKFIIITAGVAVVFFGVMWGAKYKRVYLDPWPNDELRDSVFMRMTASNVKPFDVTQFMRENDLSGKMFNYWTEGGALAFGQKPDPETGRTPLQVAQDGRAQAAYDHSKFLNWQAIYGGGAEASKVRSTGKLANLDEMDKIGKYLNGVMEKAGIWVFVVPESQFSLNRDEPQKSFYYPLALSGQSNWVPAYTGNHQRLYVNVNTAKGKDIYQKLMTGKLKFPTEYSEKLTLARNYLASRNPVARKKGFEFSKAAFAIDVSRVSMIQLVSDAGRWPELAIPVRDHVEVFVNDFQATKAVQRKKGGYGKRLMAAWIGAQYLSNSYKRTKNTVLSEKYGGYNKAWRNEYSLLMEDVKW